MPTNPLRYPCGTCARKFEEMEHLRQHIKDLHSPSSPPTSRSPPKQPIFQCGTPGCTRKFGKVEDLRQHTKDSHSSSSPPPKQPVFKCGAEGCEATAPFLKLPLLHQHTAQTHPKSKKKKVSSGLSTLASSPPGPPIAVTNTQSVLMTPQVGCLPLPSCTANEAQHASHTFVYSRQPSTSTSLAAQNSVARPDFPSVVSDTQEELLQRLRQLELRHMLINKSALKVGMHFVELAEDIIRSSTNDRRISFLKDLQERVEWMSKHNDVYSLAYSAKFRADVEKLLQSFGYDDKLRMKKAISEDDQVILHLLREVIYSRQEDILHLSDEKATGFTDALHKVACLIGRLNDNLFIHSALLWRVTTQRSSLQHADC
ncbi:hypothetical protein B0H19DRAFT_1104171 [Mycena capillaripes]|nr:hypothetical protein B0H19DRAFT_1104171 [Mycena capillaripes]